MSQIDYVKLKAELVKYKIEIILSTAQGRKELKNIKQKEQTQRIEYEGLTHVLRILDGKERVYGRGHKNSFQELWKDSKPSTQKTQ